MNEIIEFRSPAPMALEAQTAELRRMSEALSAMAAMLQATTESMEELRRQVRMLEKVTPGQAAAINRAIRERAAEVCSLYFIKDGEKPAAAAIRKAVRGQFGAGSAREISRCDYDVVVDYIRNWDDWDAMTKIGRGSKA